MKDVRREQIKALFENLKETLRNGLWLNGFEGEGEFKRWYNNGKLFIHSFYKDGKRDGEYRAWYGNGQLDVHAFYKDGELDGEYKQWHNNGQLYVHAFYKDGKVVKRLK